MVNVHDRLSVIPGKLNEIVVFPNVGMDVLLAARRAPVGVEEVPYESGRIEMQEPVSMRKFMVIFSLLLLSVLAGSVNRPQQSGSPNPAGGIGDRISFFEIGTLRGSGVPYL